MTGANDHGPRTFASILHPTTLTSEGIDAFAHALRIALDARGRLTVLHVSGDRATPWTEFPGIRDTLVRWGKLDRGASRDMVGKLGLEAVKLRLKGTSPVKGILQRAKRSDSDLLVLAAHQREGLSRWWTASSSEPVARRANMPSLVIPVGRRGFVDIREGTVALTRVLVPVAANPSSTLTLRAVARLLETLDVDEVEIGLLHVGGGERPQVAVPQPRQGWKQVELHAVGPVIDSIVSESERWGADLIAMSTLGHDSAWDRLWGSTTERVIRQVSVPVLTVPVGS